MYWTIPEKKFMYVQHCMVIWSPSDVQEDFLDTFQVGLHILCALSNMVFRCDVRHPPFDFHSQEHSTMH